MSFWRIWAVSIGYLTSATCVCTALYHSSTLISACIKLVNKSNLVLNTLACGLQNSSNFYISLLRTDLHWTNSMSCTGLTPNHLTRPQSSCSFLFQTTLQVHILACSHILVSISRICCTGFHLQSSPWKGLLYMAYTYLHLAPL